MDPNSVEIIVTMLSKRILYNTIQGYSIIEYTTLIGNCQFFFIFFILPWALPESVTTLWN